MNPIQKRSDFDRRAFLNAGLTAGAAVAAVLVPSAARAQTQRLPIGPEPARYPAAAWKVLDDRFKKYQVGNTPLIREWTGALWAEGCAWNGVGRYAVFSDIPNNRQMRWDEATGTVSVMRPSSNYSNGNTFDMRGREISCEHQTNRVVRYEYQGDPTVLAETFEGKRLNAPNDVIVHPVTGDIFFTDPGYGIQGYYEGSLREPELPTAVYHIDSQTGKLTKLTDEIKKPNGLCMSPDYRTLYVADTAPTNFPTEKAKVYSFTMQNNGRSLTNKKEFVVLPAGLHDGIRADMDGNIWCATGFGGEGVDGVHCYAPDGTRLGQIVLQEWAANLCFVGPHRNRLLICASQSIYTIYTGAIGANIT
jgi:gluconolactonase